MEREEFLQEKNFVEMPAWYKRLETYFRPMLENQLNEIRSELGSLRTAETLVRNEGIELAIQRYGLRIGSDNNDPEPSGSEVPEKKVKLEEDNQDVLLSAIGSAIADKGLSVEHFS